MGEVQYQKCNEIGGERCPHQQQSLAHLVGVRRSPRSVRTMSRSIRHGDIDRILNPSINGQRTANKLLKLRHTPSKSLKNASDPGASFGNTHQDLVDFRIHVHVVTR